MADFQDMMNWMLGKEPSPQEWLRRHHMHEPLRVWSPSAEYNAQTGNLEHRTVNNLRKTAAGLPDYPFYAHLADPGYHAGDLVDGQFADMPEYLYRPGIHGTSLPDIPNEDVFMRRFYRSYRPGKAEAIMDRLNAALADGDTWIEARKLIDADYDRYHNQTPDSWMPKWSGPVPELERRAGWDYPRELRYRQMYGAPGIAEPVIGQMNMPHDLMRDPIPGSFDWELSDRGSPAIVPDDVRLDNPYSVAGMPEKLGLGRWPRGTKWKDFRKFSPNSVGAGLGLGTLLGTLASSPDYQKWRSQHSLAGTVADVAMAGGPVGYALNDAVINPALQWADQHLGISEAAGRVDQKLQDLYKKHYFKEPEPDNAYFYGDW